MKLIFFICTAQGRWVGRVGAINVKIRLYPGLTNNLCGDVFHVKFWVDSESGLIIDLGGHISELSLSHFWGFKVTSTLAPIKPIGF